MTHILSRDGLGRAFVASPEDRVSLFRRMNNALAEAAFRLDVPTEIVSSARRIALRRLFGEDRIVLEPPDLYMLACRTIREAGQSSVSHEVSPTEPDHVAPKRACSPMCLLETVGRVLRRLSNMELAVMEFRRGGLDDADVTMVLGVPQDRLVANRKRIMDAMRDLRCDHLKAAFRAKGDRRD